MAKVRNGFVSNSSSSSFIIGSTGGFKNSTVLEEFPNLKDLQLIKIKCIENKLEIPKEIQKIEEHFDINIEELKGNEIYITREETIEVPQNAILYHDEDKIIVDITKLPKEIKTLTFIYEEER